ncbi:MAG TPA: hypothetical protein VHC46_08190 [Thermodesulfobacteriota bacterium]|nr:hypothetical protein [Thermodesulfobacteriota bacterium]
MIELRRQALGAEYEHTGFLPLGSWGLNVYATRKYYTDVLGHHFKRNIEESQAADKPGANLYMIGSPKASVIFKGQAALRDESTAEWEHPAKGVASLATGRFQVLIFTKGRTPDILIYVREPQYSHEAFHGHVFEIIHKILFMFDMFYIHAGAVRWKGRVSAFIGDRGNGKSTICLRLAREGAVIISDDHIVFKKKRGRFLVSGCEDVGRVTGKTEKALFGKRLDTRAKRFGGVLKKEVLLAEYFECAHFKDFPINDIFFTRIGEKFGIAPVSPSDAVLRLIESTKPFFRFNRAGDYADYLGYFSELAGKTRLYDLTLTRNLKDLDGLVAFLGKNET